MERKENGPSQKNHHAQKQRRNWGHLVGRKCHDFQVAVVVVEDRHEEVEHEGTPQVMEAHCKSFPPREWSSSRVGKVVGFDQSYASLLA